MDSKKNPHQSLFITYVSFHGAVSTAEKLNGLFVISGLRGDILTAKSSSSGSGSSFLSMKPEVIASNELMRVLGRETFRRELSWTGMGGEICVIPRWKGRGAVPWNAEKEDTARSPTSGERGLLIGRLP